MSDPNSPGDGLNAQVKGIALTPGAGPATVPQDVKNLAMFSTVGMAVVAFLSPLIVYLTTKDEPSKRFARDHAKAGLNFQIVFWPLIIISGILILWVVGIFMMVALMAWSIWVIIAGTLQAGKGEEPHYPLVPKILE